MTDKTYALTCGRCGVTIYFRKEDMRVLNEVEQDAVKETNDYVKRELNAKEEVKFLGFVVGHKQKFEGGWSREMLLSLLHHPKGIVDCQLCGHTNLIERLR